MMHTVGVWLTCPLPMDKGTCLLHVLPDCVNVWTFNLATQVFDISKLPRGDSFFRTSIASECWSGEGVDWSEWYVMESDTPPPGYEVGAASFRLVGDRACGSWAECELVHRDAAKVSYRFRMQGHNEVLELKEFYVWFVTEEVKELNPDGSTKTTEKVNFRIKINVNGKKATSTGLLTVIYRRS